MADKVRETANKRRKTRERAQATTLATGVQGTTPGAPAQGHSQYGQPTGHLMHTYQHMPPASATQMVPYQGGSGTPVFTYAPVTAPYGPVPPPHGAPGSFMFPIVANGLAQRRLPRELH
eukprot:scaffold330608_cov72-Attheya_sp.AAC.1